MGKASQIVADTTVSGLMVPPTLVRQVGSTRDVRIGNGSDLTLPDDTMDQDTAYVISGHTLYMLDDPSSRPTWHLAEDDTASPSEKRPPKRAVTTRQQHGRISVVRTTPPRPSVGDIRVSWKETIAPQEGVSILALQQDGELVPWTDTKTKRTLYHIQEGSWSSKQMIQQLLKRSKLMTNVLRCVGFFGNYFGWSGFLSFLPAIVQRIPFLRFILAPLVGIATSLVAFGVSFGLSAAVFCLAWLRFRPLLAAGVAVLSGLGFYGPLYYAKFKRSPEVELMGESLMNGDVGGAFFDDGPEEKTI